MSETGQPVIFIGHGSPMNAIEDNEFSLTWQMIAGTFPEPKAIVCISAHWEARESMVTAAPQPRTIHDFVGFPNELFDMRYPAPGDPDLAQRITGMVKSTPVRLDARWGLDHGTWSVLCRMYPRANIPVIQLSLNRALTPEEHYTLGRELQPLRKEGILLLGSGNVVHNLGLMVWENTAFDWAVRFDAQIKKWIDEGEHQMLINYEKLGNDARLSINSAEHYLPLLYVLGAAEKEEPHHFFNEKVWGGSLSMRCVFFG